jgi:hypothetical protein
LASSILRRNPRQILPVAGATLRMTIVAAAGGSYGPLQNAASATSPFANIEY